MAVRGVSLASLLLVLSCLAITCHGEILFDHLDNSLVVTASHKEGQVLKAGEDKVTITWGINPNLSANTGSDYKTIKVKLCYAPISQVDRAWRKTEENLSKDKTCQFKIVERPYNKTVQSFEWIIERDVPTATYFLRAYAFNSENHEVAYGQNTDKEKTTNLFQIQAITGRHVSLDIASVCFSAFSVVSLFGFFVAEKRKAKRSQQK